MAAKTNAEDFDKKIRMVRKLAAEMQLQGILINLQTNLSWLTGGGRSFIGLASEAGCFSMLVSQDEVYLISNNIEIGRLADEELEGLKLDKRSFYWFQESEKGRIIKDILNGKAYKTDSELPVEFAMLRRTMTENEIAKYRQFSLDTAFAVEDLCRSAFPGMTEFQAAGLISQKLWELGVEPVTLLIGSDERLFKYRHPLPTEKKIEKYLMVAVCVREYGLFTSCTRFIHFGKIPAEIKIRHKAVTTVDAAFIKNTVPGAAVKDIFKSVMDIYRETGFEDEWKLHHQGGLTGYAGREYRGTPDCIEIVEENQVFAWNPSIKGTKSEDTILVHGESNEILTHTGKYEYVDVEYEGIKRPAILER